MSSSSTRSVLVTTVDRPVSEVGEHALAAMLSLTVRRLADYEPSLSAIIGSDIASEDALIVGTGNFIFDAKVAAALGIPLLLDAPEGPARDLAREQIEEIGAFIVDADSAILTEDVHAASAKAAPVVGPETFEAWLLEKAAAGSARIVLPEGDDDRILQAAHQLLARDIANLTILGEPSAIAARAEELGLDLAKAELVNHLRDERREAYAEEFARLRAKKGLTLEQAREQLTDVSYFATMMVHLGDADGMVSGASHPTSATLKPAFQIVKTAPGSSLVSSVFLMVLPGRVWAFGDCAVNPNPTAEQVAEIAVASARTAAQFDIDPRVAILSYSTGASGAGPDVDKATEAVRLAQEAAPGLAVDGPVQFDASVDEGVARKKMPGSSVAGRATVFCFPDLEAGNIGYKIAQRTAGALAVGPILQGLNKPINDLSRGATVSDIVNTVAITAIQAEEA